VKLRILLLMLAGAAGVGSSFALANDGNGYHGHDVTGTNGSCQRGAVFGTAAGPQTFTVTVGHPGWHSSLAPGQVVTVTVGSSGNPVRIVAMGCVNGSSVTARSALVSGGWWPKTTTGTTAGTTTGATTTGTTTTSTSTNPGGDKGGRRHHHHHGTPGGTTTTGTTTTGTTTNP